MIIVKGRQIEPIVRALTEIMTNKSIRLSGKTALKLLKIDHKLRNEFDDIEKVRWQLLEKYGNKKDDQSLEVDNNGSVVFTEENRAAFSMEYGTILSSDIEIDTPKITEDELDGIQGVTPATIAILEPLIDIKY